jgi:hypothetical protein
MCLLGIWQQTAIFSTRNVNDWLLGLLLKWQKEALSGDYVRSFVCLWQRFWDFLEFQYKYSLQKII